MRGVLEEKNNRIVEVIISSVRPTDLMLGKIIGIGLVGLTQYTVWGPARDRSRASGGRGHPGDARRECPPSPARTIGAFVLFFLLGYFLYASLYARSPLPSTRSRRPSSS